MDHSHKASQNDFSVELATHDNDDDVDDYLRKIYLARKKRSQNRSSAAEPAIAAPITTESTANCVANAKAAALKRTSHRSQRAPAEPEPEPEQGLFASSFAAAAQLRKKQQLSHSTSSSNGSAAAQECTATDRFSHEGQPIMDQKDVRRVGQVIRQARQRGSPEPEAEPGANQKKRLDPSQNCSLLIHSSHVVLAAPAAVQEEGKYFDRKRKAAERCR